MSEPKNHHYVPRGFLKSWEDVERKVWVYERKRGVVLPPYKKSTKPLCAEKKLYSYTDKVKPEQRNSIEKNLLKKIDDDAVKILQKLYNVEGIVGLSEQERFYFSAFLVSLRIRTPESVKYNSVDAQKIFKKILEKNDPRLEEGEIKKELNGKSLLEWVEIKYPSIMGNIGLELLVGHIIDNKFVKPIYEMYWAIRRINNNQPSLLTSDRPLILLGNKDTPNFGLSISISPSHIFFASKHKETLYKLMNWPEKDLVKQTNISTIQQAEKKAFAVDTAHKMQFFRKRLATRHDILPWAGKEYQPLE